MRVVIFDGLGVNDLVKMGGATVCFLNDEEDSAEEDGPSFSLMFVIILLMNSLDWSRFSNFSKLGFYLNAFRIFSS